MPIDHESLAISSVAVGTIPNNDAAEVGFQATVNSFSPGLVPSFTNQSTVHYNAGSTVTSNTETYSSGTGGAIQLASLTLGDHVYVDANHNNVYDAGEGVSGVALTLYTLGTALNPGTSGVDVNGDGINDTAVTTTTTGADGVYSFTGLAPGSYVVSIDAGNFASGQALANDVVIATAVDPSTDNTPGDNNAVNGPSGTVVTKEVTLAYGSEPASDATPVSPADHDVNNTVGLGLVPNSPPTANNDSVTVNEDSPLDLLVGQQQPGLGATPTRPSHRHRLGRPWHADPPRLDRSASPPATTPTPR